LVEIRLGEWDRNVVGLADVVDEDGNIEILDLLGETGVVGVVVLCKVHGESAGLYLVLFGNFGSEGLELASSTGDEEDVVAFGGNLESEFLSESIRGTGDDGPGTLGSKL